MDELKERCRERLLASGFLEATKFKYNFYRPNTMYTAFFVNLKDRGNKLGICYGIASTAFTRMKGCENSLDEYGILNEDSCFRYFLYVELPQDILVAEEKIRAQLELYEGISKEELICAIKEKRKQFIDTIHGKLKPAGFRKKGNEWSYALSDDHVLYFTADKSSFCDSYRFLINVSSLRKIIRSYCWCNIYEMQPKREEAFDPHSAFRFDWQLNTREELLGILDEFLNEYIDPVEAEGIEALAQKDYIQARCNCDKRACEACWLASTEP